MHLKSYNVSFNASDLVIRVGRDLIDPARLADFLTELEQEAKSVSKPFPKGWDEKRIQPVLEHYENQSDEQAAAEDEYAFEAERTVIEVPTEPMPWIREILALYKPT